MTAPAASDRVAAARRRDRVMAQHLALGVLRSTWMVFLGFWVVMAIVVGVLVYVQGRYDTLDEPELAFMGPARIFLFVMGIIVPVGTIAVHIVGAGGTRRAFARGLWALALGVGVVFSVVAVSLTGAQVVVSATSTLPNLLHLGDVENPWLLWYGESAANTVYFLAGAAIGTGYYRWGFWGGTGAMLLALVPVLGTELALAGSWFGEPLGQTLGLGDLPLAVSILGSLLCVVAAAGLLHLIVRDVTVRARLLS